MKIHAKDRKEIRINHAVAIHKAQGTIGSEMVQGWRITRRASSLNDTEGLGDDFTIHVSMKYWLLITDSQGTPSSRREFPSAISHKPKNVANNFGKFGVPSPVTGSHPVVAVKPGVPHP